MNIATGYLDVAVHDQNQKPIPNAAIRVYQMEDGQVSYEAHYQTDEEGMCRRINLLAPDPKLSQQHHYTGRPYEQYDVEIKKENYDIEERKGVQIFGEEGSSISVEMQASAKSRPRRNVIQIDEHSLFQGSEDRYA